VTKWGDEVPAHGYAFGDGIRQNPPGFGGFCRQTLGSAKLTACGTMI
jgi:hypothetical protein